MRLVNGNEWVIIRQRNVHIASNYRHRQSTVQQQPCVPTNIMDVLWVYRNWRRAATSASAVIILIFPNNDINVIFQSYVTVNHVSI